jgi:hypothetical protein
MGQAHAVAHGVSQREPQFGQIEVLDAEQTVIAQGLETVDHGGEVHVTLLVRVDLRVTGSGLAQLDMPGQVGHVEGIVATECGPTRVQRDAETGYFVAYGPNGGGTAEHRPGTGFHPEMRLLTEQGHALIPRRPRREPERTPRLGDGSVAIADGDGQRLPGTLGHAVDGDVEMVEARDCACLAASVSGQSRPKATLTMPNGRAVVIATPPPRVAPTTLSPHITPTPSGPTRPGFASGSGGWPRFGAGHRPPPAAGDA